MKFDPPIRWTVADRKGWQQHHQEPSQGTLFTRSGKRKRRRQELNAKAKACKAKVYRERKAGRLVVPPTCAACGQPLDPSTAEFAHFSYDRWNDGAFMHQGCHRSRDRNNPLGGCQP